MDPCVFEAKHEREPVLAVLVTAIAWVSTKIREKWCHAYSLLFGDISGKGCLAILCEGITLFLVQGVDAIS